MKYVTQREKVLYIWKRSFSLAGASIFVFTIFVSACSPMTNQRASDDNTQRGIDQFVLDSENSTILDKSTGLMWTACPVGYRLDNGKCEGVFLTRKRDEFVYRTEYFDLAGHSDWRLPTADELLSLVECSNGREKAYKNFSDQMVETKYVGTSGGYSEICKKGGQPLLPAIFPDSVRRNRLWSGTLVGGDITDGVVLSLGQKNLITSVSSFRERYNRALYVRSDLPEESAAIEETKLAPPNSMKGRQIVYKAGGCKSIQEFEVFSSPDRSGRPYRFNEAIGVILLHPVWNMGVTREFEGYKARASTGDIVYVTYSNWSPNTSKSSDYTDHEITSERVDHCSLVMSLEEYNARLSVIQKGKKQVRLSKERKEQEAVERRDRRLKEWKEQAARPYPKIGMTKDQVRNDTSLGDPDSINRTTTADGVSEQWVYEKYTSATYLYFVNGILQVIQD